MKTTSRRRNSLVERSRWISRKWAFQTGKMGRQERASLSFLRRRRSLSFRMASKPSLLVKDCLLVRNMDGVQDKVFPLTTNEWKIKQRHAQQWKEMITTFSQRKSSSFHRPHRHASKHSQAVISSAAFTSRALTGSHRRPRLPRRTTFRPPLLTTQKASSFLRPNDSLAMTMPLPVCRASLRELDVTSFATNIYLRHNVLFDPNMNFQPNLENDMVRKKKLQGETFWDQVRKELSGYRDAVGRYFPPNYAIVARLLSEIKDILMDLTSSTNQSSLDMDHRLNLKWMSHQLSLGTTVHVSSWVEYLGQTMLTYCAPCRDGLIHGMLSMKLQSANDYALLLRQILEICEWMKLDLANHYLKQLRPHILETSVEFEWSYFFQQLSSHKVSLKLTTYWMEEAISTFSLQRPKESLNPETVFNHGFLQIVQQCVPWGEEKDSNAQPKTFPEIFYLDVNRLRRLRKAWVAVSQVTCLIIIIQPWLAQGGSQQSMDDILSECFISFHTLIQDSFVPFTPNSSISTKTSSSSLSLSHLSHHAIHLIRKYTSDPSPSLTSQQISMIHHLVEKTLSPSLCPTSTSCTNNHRLYEMVENRISQVIWTYLNTPFPSVGTPLDPSQLRSFGLLPATKHLGDIAELLYRIAIHHKNVYKNVLNLLFSSFREKAKNS